MKNSNKPYTYLIGWSNLDKWYYGVRYSKNCDPSDLWVSYKTSSEYVKNMVSKYGDPDIIQIRRVFDSAIKAKEWEDKVLRRINAKYNTKFLNQSNTNSFNNIVMDNEMIDKIILGKKNNKKEKKKWYTNDIEEILLPISKIPPENFRAGRLNEVSERMKKLNSEYWTTEKRKEAGKKTSKKTKGVKKPDGFGENISKITKGKPKPWGQGENNVSKRDDVRKTISQKLSGRNFYNNGKKEIFVKECNVPDGFIKGRLLFKKNNDYEILTPSGFVDFDGIVKKNKKTIKIFFESGNEIVCTKTHKFIHNGIEILAELLNIGDELNGEKIKNIIDNGYASVYDPINVDNGNLYYSNDLISHNCNFLGSSYTLINAATLSRLQPSPPLKVTEYGLTVLEEPKQDRTYVMVVDTSEGVGGDYSAFTVIDVTELPYTVVAKFRNNSISPLLYPSVILGAAKSYNNAFLLMEINRSEQVAYIVHHEMEYENILFVTKGKHGQVVSSGFGGLKPNYGVSTDKKVKRIGCANLKTLIEENKLLITDADIISEISTFVEYRGSYKADEGYHDDLIMTLVLFGWLTTQEYFKDLTNINLRKMLFEMKQKEIDEQILPIGYNISGKETEPTGIVMDGDYWVFAEPKELLE